jgi:predicted transcriptional regulator
LTEDNTPSEALPMMKIVTDIITAYVSKNAVRSADLSDLIGTVHSTLLALSSGQVAPEPAPEPIAAVSIKKSITPNHIVCLEDGLKFKSLKRHLATSHGMTPEQYQERWKLPTNYPMVAPAYAATRSEMAKQNGLGQVRQRKPTTVASADGVKKGRGRPKKSA